ncbi:hypothetical protein CY658_31660 [Variovorax sp. RO1]|nr:hypothetical protein CY658_31660 [Variovorax sp. RO1]
MKIGHSAMGYREDELDAWIASRPEKKRRGVSRLSHQAFSIKPRARKRVHPTFIDGRACARSTSGGCDQREVGPSPLSR